MTNYPKLPPRLIKTVSFLSRVRTVKPPNGIAMRVSNEDRLALRDLVHPSWTTSDHVFRPPAVFIELDQPGCTSAPEWSGRLVGRRGLSRLTNRPGKLAAVAMPTRVTTLSLGRPGDRCERPHCPVRWRLLAVAQRNERLTRRAYSSSLPQPIPEHVFGIVILLPSPSLNVTLS
jgi:hypothetical protein